MTVTLPLARSSGILLHVTSLPGPFGIGDLGPSAYAWVDALARARQTWWQVLPIRADRLRRLPLPVLFRFCRQP